MLRYHILVRYYATEAPSDKLRLSFALPHQVLISHLKFKNVITNFEFLLIQCLDNI